MSTIDINITITAMPLELYTVIFLFCNIITGVEAAPSGSDVRERRGASRILRGTKRARHARVSVADAGSDAVRSRCEGGGRGTLRVRLAGRCKRVVVLLATLLLIFLFVFSYYAAG